MPFKVGDRVCIIAVNEDGTVPNECGEFYEHLIGREGVIDTEAGYSNDYYTVDVGELDPLGDNPEFMEEELVLVRKAPVGLNRRKK